MFTRKVLTVLALGYLMGASGQVLTAGTPTYSLETILHTNSCTSVDLSPDGTTILARDMIMATLVEGYRTFDAQTYEPNTWYPMGTMQAPWRGLVSADSDYFYATSYYGGAVKKIALSTGSQVASMSVGSWPFQMAFDSARRFLYVEQGCPGTGVLGSLKVIDTATDSVVGTVPLNGEPSGSIVSPGDDFVYVESSTSSAHTLYKIRTSDLGVAGTFSTTASSMNERGSFSLSPDGGTAYLPDPSGNGVHVLSTSSMTQTDLWSLPGVAGFFVSPDGTHALVTPPFMAPTPTLRVFDLSSEAVVQALDVGVPLDGRWTPYWDLAGGALEHVYLPAGSNDGLGGVLVLTPEPATLSLLALAGPASLRRKRRALATSE
jgi:DNA-binding beta-propeller fold protein YncE